MSSKSTIRLTVVGDGDTGKTCMLIVYKDKKFDERYVPTVFDVYSMDLEINSTTYRIILSDTAGQEDFGKLRTFAYKDVDAFILTYAVDRRASYENVFLKWAPELKRFAPKAKIIVAATKTDLRTKQNDLQPEDGEMLARDIGANGFIETSSKLMNNVDKAFEMAISAVLYNKNFLRNRRRRSSQCTCL
ncbi:unnamed protein product [Phaedon cochleariae]|uniref:Uncharacterized protein n=1 Tax=Phaedon cochleariae TaxID=80249 RepID=A0A9P0DSU1_PHACE|nr:unnamed protein product [Phaedon cochleariae]